MRRPMLAFALFALPWNHASAHPGSGIVVDPQGSVYFQDSAARTIWKADPQGRVTSHYDKMGGHWMALDEEGKFAHSRPTLVERIAPALNRDSPIVDALNAAIAEAKKAFNAAEVKMRKLYESKDDGE